METSVLLEVLQSLKVVLRSVSTTTGELCVMIPGAMLMLVWPAYKLASQEKMPWLSEVLPLVKELEPFFLMMLPVLVLRTDLLIACSIQDQVVSTVKMLVFAARYVSDFSPNCVCVCPLV